MTASPEHGSQYTEDDFPRLIAALRRGDDSARVEILKDLKQSGYQFDQSEEALLAPPQSETSISNLFDSVRPKRDQSTMSYRERLNRVADILEEAHQRRAGSRAA